MNAARAASKGTRVPRFSTTATADVDIDPEELEEVGWVSVGTDGELRRSDDEWTVLIRRNHDDEHEGPMVWCRHELCMAVTR